MNNAPILPNPYVGPRMFTRADQDRFFGRENEARELLSLVVSQRLVLFYAQSGAGKSSLIHARLVPKLQERRFLVLPVARIGAELPGGIDRVDNAYVFSLMLSLDQGGSDPGSMAQLQLDDFLAHLAHRAGEDGDQYFYAPMNEVAAKTRKHILIIDQFEEIFTTHIDRWEDRAAFFEQLDQAMTADPRLWVLLALREDYVAALDPYAHLLNDHMRARSYMQRMDQVAALQAIQNPARQAGRPFAEGVAERLVRNLSQIRVPGEADNRPGQYVEPVQLQVVCYQLWENLKDRPASQISDADLEDYGDVDNALSDFYNKAIKEVRDLPDVQVSDLELRLWFSKQLITEAGTRNIIDQGKETTKGMPNQVVKALTDRYLLHAEPRAGAIWIELVHDRFVGPIRRANRDAEAKQKELEVKQAQKLAESEKRRAEQQTRLNRRLRIFEVVLIAGLLLAIVTTMLALVEKKQADSSREEAERSKTQAEADRTQAVSETARAESEKSRADHSFQLARALLLEAKASALTDVDLRLALRLDLESALLVPTDETETLYSIISDTRGLAATGRVANLGNYSRIVFSSDRLHYVVADANVPGHLYRMHDDPTGVALTGQITESFAISEVIVPRNPAVFFSPDLTGTFFVVDYVTSTAELRSITGTMVTTLTDHIKSVKFSPNAAYLVVDFADDSRPELRRTRDGQHLDFLTAVLSHSVSFLPSYGYASPAVVFSPDPEATYFIADYGSMPGELRRSADGRVVVTLTGKIATSESRTPAIFFSPAPTVTHFVVDYQDKSPELRSITSTPDSITSTVVTKLMGRIASVQFSPDGAYIVVRYVGAPAEVRRTADGSVVADRKIAYVVFNTLSSGARSILPVTPDEYPPQSFTPPSNYFLVEYENRSMELRRTLDGQTGITLTGSVTYTSLSGLSLFSSPAPTATYFVVDYVNAPAELRSITRTIKLPGKVASAQFSQDATYVAVRYVDGSTEVRRTADGKVVANKIADVAFSRNPAERGFIVSYRNAPAALHPANGAVVALSGAITSALASAIQFSPDPDTTYFRVSYTQAVTELRRTADGSPVTPTGKIAAIFFEPAYFIVKYDDAPGEVWGYQAEHRTPLTGKIDRIYVSPVPTATYFVVDYKDSPAELRGIDGSFMATLTGVISSVTFSREADPGSAHFVVLYQDGTGELRRVDDRTEVVRLPTTTLALNTVNSTFFTAPPTTTYVMLGNATRGIGAYELHRVDTGAVVFTTTNAWQPPAIFDDPSAGVTYVRVLKIGSTGAISTELSKVQEDSSYLVYKTTSSPAFFDPRSRWQIEFSNSGGSPGPVYLLDLTYLSALQGHAYDLPWPDLVSVICRSLFSPDQFDESSLKPYRDKYGLELRACSTATSMATPAP